MAMQTSGKRIFMTGATGYVGMVITELAIAEGYTIRALSRSEKGDAKLKGLGATPVRGDLHSLNIIKNESAQADIIIHLADSFLDNFDASKYEEVIRTDGAAVDAMVEGIKGTNKPLITSSGALIAAPDPNGGETDEEAPIDTNLFIERYRSERYALSQAEKGIRVMNIRLAPLVYGRGGSGVSNFLSVAAKNGQTVYIGDGHWQTSAAHVDDAARLYLLAAAHGKPGENFNGVSATDISARQLAEAMATALKVPCVSVTEEEAVAQLGPFMPKFLTSQCRASGAKAMKNLGWQPREPGLLEDITQGSYLQLAQRLKEGQTLEWGPGR